MSGTAVGMMIFVCGLIWGGFVFLLLRAIRRERRKEKQIGDGS